MNFRTWISLKCLIHFDAWMWKPHVTTMGISRKPQVGLVRWGGEDGRESAARPDWCLLQGHIHAQFIYHIFCRYTCMCHAHIYIYIHTQIYTDVNKQRYKQKGSKRYISALHIYTYVFSRMFNIFKRPTRDPRIRTFSKKQLLCPRQAYTATAIRSITSAKADDTMILAAKRVSLVSETRLEASLTSPILVPRILWFGDKSTSAKKEVRRIATQAGWRNRVQDSAGQPC